VGREGLRVERDLREPPLEQKALRPARDEVVESGETAPENGEQSKADGHGDSFVAVTIGPAVGMTSGVPVDFS
jgi:hypothetical protein